MRSRWNSPASVAVIGGMVGMLGLVVGNNVHIGSLQLFGTEYDKPAIAQSPRTAICFWHQNKPAGYRLMQRQEDGTWLETQPDGMSYRHIEVGRVKLGPWHGVILERKENPRNEPWPVQLFIPDAGAHNALLFRPDPKAEWEYISTIAPSTDNCPRLSERP